MNRHVYELDEMPKMLFTDLVIGMLQKTYFNDFMMEAKRRLDFCGLDHRMLAPLLKIEMAIINAREGSDNELYGLLLNKVFWSMDYILKKENLIYDVRFDLDKQYYMLNANFTNIDTTTLALGEIFVVLDEADFIHYMPKKEEIFSPETLYEVNAIAKGAGKSWLNDEALKRMIQIYKVSVNQEATSHLLVNINKFIDNEMQIVYMNKYSKEFTQNHNWLPYTEE